MRKIIAAINMTLDGDCDNKAGVPDEKVRDNYMQLMHNGMEHGVETTNGL